MQIPGMRAPPNPLLIAGTPRWHDFVRPGIGDELAEVLVHVGHRYQDVGMDRHWVPKLA